MVDSGSEASERVWTDSSIRDTNVVSDRREKLPSPSPTPPQSSCILSCYSDTNQPCQMGRYVQSSSEAGFRNGLTTSRATRSDGLCSPMALSRTTGMWNALHRQYWVHTQLHIRGNPYCKGRLTFQGAFNCSSCILALFIATTCMVVAISQNRTLGKHGTAFIYKSSLQCLKTTSFVSLDRT